MPARLEKKPEPVEQSLQRWRRIGAAAQLPAGLRKRGAGLLDPGRGIAAGRQPDPVFVIDQRSGAQQPGPRQRRLVQSMTRGPNDKPPSAASGRRSISAARRKTASPMRKFSPGRNPSRVAAAGSHDGTKHAVILRQKQAVASGPAGLIPTERADQWPRLRQGSIGCADKADRRHRPPATRSGCGACRRANAPSRADSRSRIACRRSPGTRARRSLAGRSVSRALTSPPSRSRASARNPASTAARSEPIAAIAPTPSTRQARKTRNPRTPPRSSRPARRRA